VREERVVVVERGVVKGVERIVAVVDLAAVAQAVLHGEQELSRLAVQRAAPVVRARLEGQALNLVDALERYADAEHGHVVVGDDRDRDIAGLRERHQH